MRQYLINVQMHGEQGITVYSRTSDWTDFKDLSDMWLCGILEELHVVAVF